MIETGRTIRCGNCDHELVADTGPKGLCPKCGSNKQKVSLEFADSVTVKARDRLEGKVKDDRFTGKRKVRRHFIHGADPRVSKGDYVHKDRVIDKDENLYLERIVEEDGTIIRDVQESLKAHTGHGSAKFKKGKDGSPPAD